MSAMKWAFQPSWVAVVAICLSGCAADPIGERLPFSDSLIGDYGLTEMHKRRLQYYTSDAIHLAQAASNNLRGIGEGRLIERGNTSINNVEIPAGTPGVVVGSGPNWLAVSFEPNSHLYFVSNQAQVNSPYWRDRRDGDRYYLYAPDWDGRAGTVRLGNIDYQAVDSSIDTFLLVDREALYSTESRSGSLSGRWLDSAGRRW
jgi:hypothetical protein